ncbi:unnamed protein product [Symbiodinium natans]|uniref:Uncharacterized protein n=1 Tax=Symbiodinium natans TaxID=878477 RepID=A0A812M014_9DINO|nr:unnamed protein product [Symbiodinium natans]
MDETLRFLLDVIGKLIALALVISSLVLLCLLGKKLLATEDASRGQADGAPPSRPPEKGYEPLMNP